MELLAGDSLRNFAAKLGMFHAKIKNVECGIFCLRMHECAELVTRLEADTRWGNESS